MALVSIIIPCYNAEKYVAAAIQSALEQTYRNCEVIVIDDGSTDGSLEVIKRFDARICWETGPNRGGCAARNAGLRLAKGDYIQFLDADDLMSSNKIDFQVKALINASENAIAACVWRHFDEMGYSAPDSRNFWKNYASGEELLIDMWLAGGYFNPACWLVPSKLIQKHVGMWNEALAADQDGEYFGRVLMVASEVVFVPAVEVSYRKPTENNVSQSMTERAFLSRAESIRVVSALLARNQSPKAKAAVRKRWINLAYLGTAQRKELMEVCLSEAAKYPRSMQVAEFSKGTWIARIAYFIGAGPAIRLRKKLLAVLGRKKL